MLIFGFALYLQHVRASCSYRDAVDFEEESERVAFDNLDAALEKYKLGTLPGIEFREFQRSYIDAVDRKVSALYQAKISELTLLLISGKILE